MLNGLSDIDNRLDYLTENGDMLPHKRRKITGNQMKSRIFSVKCD